MRRPRLLLGGLVVMLGGMVVSEGARADDMAEIRALHAEMRRLEAKVEQLEAHHGMTHGSQHVVAGRTLRSGGHPSGGGASGTSTMGQITAMPDLSRLTIGGPTLSDDAQAAAAAENTMTESIVPTQPRLDLDSSSPLAITQTGVDSLPPIFRIGGVSVRLGGFIDFSNIYRSKNLTSGPATSWGSFPYANSPNAHTGEYRPSAQLTRLSVLLQGSPTKDETLSGYIETDFGGAAGTANSYQTNSYTPRIRQAYMTYSNTKWGFHVLAGQAWSLTTGYTQGLLSRHEQLPPVVDNNQIPGIVFTRVPQIRFIKDFGRKWWLGLSLEAPQVAYAASGSCSDVDSTNDTCAGGGDHPMLINNTLQSGTHLLYSNAGAGMLNPNAKYSMDVAPDIVLKGALDTKPAHYEIYGLARWFKAMSQSANGGPIRERVSFAGGVGGDVTVHVIPRFLQFTGNVLAGEGIGRYGPGMLPDATFKANGTPAPIPEIIGSMGLIGHPTPDLLVYLYGGVEHAGRRTYTGTDGNQYGYGVNDLALSSCNVEMITGGSCDAQTHTLADLTVGGWWHVLQGGYGAVMTGVQYTYLRKFAYKGGDGASPTTGGNTIYVTFRYLPFQ
ncbi:hypothetical protein HPC44_05095 [Komagataeibacter oboediens]|uniref:DUF3138 domain-containing protein n=1 Tax=Komagataeibacter oboediens TaxID=65958 RepID=A0ABS5SJQ5_9PROT|nr:hypothetical protein [Komagataeibacter oboediens]MBT0674448.1 hypothetical protein [Komagataeibacter oboediens]MBT0678099.1 hypothetical protein [Komagataeibacter oboediens]